MKSLKEALVHKHMDRYVKELDMKFENLEPGILVRVTEVYHGSLYWLGITNDMCNKFFPRYAKVFDDEKGAITHFDPETNGNLSFIPFSSYEKSFPITANHKNGVYSHKFELSKIWKLDKSVLSKLKDKDSIIEFLKLSYKDPEGFEKSLGL